MTILCFPHTGDGQNNENTRRYRYNYVCVGCNERTLNASILHYSFVCLRCEVPVSIHYRFCLIRVHMKVL